MRIWHMMAAVLVAAVALALLTTLPELGALLVLDLAVVSCAVVLIHYEPRILNAWSRATRWRPGPRSRPERWRLAWLHAAVVFYQAGVAMVTATTFVLVVITGMAVVALLVWAVMSLRA